jgi:hypothetical protein
MGRGDLLLLDRIGFKVAEFERVIGAEPATFPIVYADGPRLLIR